MITGTATYQELFQGLLAERVIANGEDSLIPVIKLADGSVINITQINDLIPYAYDFIDIIYTGTLINRVVFKNLGTTVATLLLTYNSDENLRTVTRS